MDTERWILDTLEFDRAVAVCKAFAERHPDTLVIVTADHECGGVNIIAHDGDPASTDPDRRLLIGYAANADRHEDWLTNPRPLADAQQPLHTLPPLNAHPSGPKIRDAAGGLLVTGQIPDPVASHTASDVPLSAYGRGAAAFSGVMDNTDVFFKAMQAAWGDLPGQRRRAKRPE